jgi:hypothetical protein
VRTQPLLIVRGFGWHFLARSSLILILILNNLAAEWEDGFRRDTNIDREIAFWCAIAQVYCHFSQDGTLDAEQRQETFDVILACANNGTEHALRTVSLRRLARPRAQAIVAYIEGLGRQSP